MAITMSSLSISMDPRAMKYNEVNTSPLWRRVSPGGAWVVLNFNESALKINETDENFKDMITVVPRSFQFYRIDMALKNSR